ncbi:MAG: ferrous iron transport protein B [Caldimicrobium sp.]|nr:ferrous iron transport protein B [Caldimicrobium sp.]
MEKIRVVLAGNPNVGKTSLLNHLCGTALTIGNFPGVTVEKKKGRTIFQGYEIEFVDIPGIYTLEFYTSLDEKVAVDYLKQGDYDLILNVVESPKLERDLYLTLQLAQLKKPMVIALNMADEAEALGIKIDEARLSEILKVPVVKTIGRTGKGTDELLEAILIAHEKNLVPTLSRIPVQIVSGAEPLNFDYASLAQGLAQEVLRKRLITQRNISDFLDNLLLHPVFGIFFLFLIYYLVFKTVFDLSSPFVDFLDSFFSDFLGKGLSSLLSRSGLSDFLVQFFGSAVIGGVGTVLTFVPTVFLMFLFITLLETSGYLPRVAFLMDRFTHRIGLHGHSVIPLLLGFGCNVPAILALRVLPDPKDRLIVMAMIPFMSCSARLVVFSFFASLFFKNPVLIVFCLYMLGIFVAVLTGLILQKTLYKKELSHFVMDLPPYRLPSAKMLFRIVWLHLKSFLFRAGTIIFAISVVIWLLLNLPLGEKNLENTYAARVGKAVSYIFAPLGLDDWRIGTSLIPAFLAREAIISTLGVIVEEEKEEKVEHFDWKSKAQEQGRRFVEAFKKGLISLINPYPTVFSNEDKEDEEKQTIKEKIKGLFQPPQALSFLVFILVYMSCMATLATIWKEAGKSYALLYFFYSLFLAYILSTLTYQFSRIILS